MAAYRVVLADDHAFFRQILKESIEAEKGFEVVGEASDGLELLELLGELTLRQSAPHLVIVDVTMRVCEEIEVSGIEVARRIKSTYPDVKILILTMIEEKIYLEHALSAGVDGYLLKRSADTELFPAIECIRQGGVYLSKCIENPSVPSKIFHRA